MSPWWLILIIPASMFVGYIIGGYIGVSQHIDDCIECAAEKARREKNKKEEESYVKENS